MKKTVLLLVLFLGTLALGMAQNKENDFLDHLLLHYSITRKIVYL